MRRYQPALLVLLSCALCGVGPPPPDVRGPQISDPHGSVLTGSTPRRFYSGASPDTLWLYGGPGSLLGRFGTATHIDWQGWTGVDPTDRPPAWQRSTFNAENLNSHGPGNHALWAGYDESQASEWIHPRGYGNNWDDSITWLSSPLAQPALGQTVALHFYYNIDCLYYDSLLVEYFRDGSWVEVFRQGGTNRDAADVFPAPGRVYDSGTSIVYGGSDYGGENGDQIELRIRFYSNSGYSDEDGGYVSVAGAAQIDDLGVQYQDGSPRSSFDDFESSGPWGWEVVPVPLSGDFAKIYANLTDPDPCRDNFSPQLHFIDDGTPPSNAPGQSTGGYPSAYDFGVPGNYAVNLDGGLLNDPGSPVVNYARSPAFAMEHPSTLDDSGQWRLVLKFGLMDWGGCGQPAFTWGVETSEDGARWRRHERGWGVAYAPTNLGYIDFTDDLSGKIYEGKTTPSWLRVFMKPSPLCGAIGSSASSPAPYFDNVSVFKVREGNQIPGWNLEPFIDAFPATDDLDVSTQIARDQLDVPFDVADYNSAATLDSMVIMVVPTDPDDILDSTDTRMVWILDKNPLFEDAIRAAPPGTKSLAAGSRLGWDQWRGELGGSFVGLGWEPGSIRVAFDPPDRDFLYPGDVFRFYFRSTAPDGIVSTLPADLTGFEAGRSWPEAFTVRAQPTLHADGTRPPVLMVDYSRYMGWAAPWDDALEELGWLAGREYDRMTIETWDELALGVLARLDPANLSEFIGPYTCLVLRFRYSTTSLRQVGEFSRLESWHALPGNRSAIHFLEDSANSESYFTDALAAQLLEGQGGDELAQSLTPQVIPQSPWESSFAVERHCRGRPLLYQLQPTGGAYATHLYEDPAAPGNGLEGFPAVIVRDRLDAEQDRIIDVTTNFDLRSVKSAPPPAPPISVAAHLLSDLLAIAGGHIPNGPTPTVDAADRFALSGLKASPNPFNPVSQIEFRLHRGDDISAQVYDLAGRQVRQLHKGWLAAGLHRLRWEGRDDRGRTVASGVYLVRIEGTGVQAVVRLALLK